MLRYVVEAGMSKAAAARQFNMTAKTVAKWVKRFRKEGVDGLRDRSSRPLSSPYQTTPATCAAIEALRRQRHTGKHIAAEVGVCPATVSRVLQRLGLNRLSSLEPAEPVRRYEREHPGEPIHLDIKKLGKFNHGGMFHQAVTLAKISEESGRLNVPLRHKAATWLIQESIRYLASRR